MDVVNTDVVNEVRSCRTCAYNLGTLCYHNSSRYWYGKMNTTSDNRSVGKCTIRGIFWLAKRRKYYNSGMVNHFAP